MIMHGLSLESTAVRSVGTGRSYVLLSYTWHVTATYIVKSVAVAKYSLKTAARLVE